MTFDNHLLDVINKLQDLVYNTIGNDSLDLPQIAVIGSQSSGKSSVLENVVGKDFLPRGIGIVTRRPLILQLVSISEDSPLIYQNNHDYVETANNPETMTLDDHLRKQSGAKPNGPPNEWGEFLHIPHKRFYNFQDIKREIENETSRIAGKNKGISKLPINLKIYSPNVLNLTLVDLPGLTKVPIGDQPTDIEVQIKNLITEYISKPNCIILAVSPANVDLANSESLKLARQFDPQGKRTIGVLSKLDLMDHGTNAFDILSGKVYPLKLGFVGVVNRSQQDIMQNKSLDDSLRSENDFFTSHPVYSKISSKCGTQFLSKTLNNILMNHIREKLPDIKAKLNTLMGQTEQELLSYGDPKQYSIANRGNLILKLISKFANNFTGSIEGDKIDNIISTKELCGGARIYYIYHNIFSKILRSIDPCLNLSMLDIRIAIRNSTGPRASLFVPELAFDSLVKPQIKLLQEPSVKCVELIYEELMKICHNNCSSNELIRYPKLQAKLIESVSDLLRQRLGPTTQYVESLIEIHRSYINTNHSSFIGAASAMTQVLDDRRAKAQAIAKQNILEAKKSRKVSGSSDVISEDGEASDNDTISDAILNGTKKHNKSESVNEKIGSKKVSRKASNSELSNDLDSSSKESFLNFFFGKDAQNKNDPVNGNVNGNAKGVSNGFSAQSSSFNTGIFSNLDTSADSSNTALNNIDGGLNFINRLPEQIEQLSLSNPQNQPENNVDELTDREQLECELIKKLIISYFNIVREMIEDQVPKSIMCLLVNYCKDNVGNKLVGELYKEDLFDDLLEEDKELRVEREKCFKLLESYKEASKIIGEIV
ncbi:dynamin-related GTPase [Saccharomycopsis crataegensis]|uniref:Dynamin-related GTPase n=1 Tax=Saccharomycopsis crataegensis TaxID=43959 RepID=A0AAV5QE43_9ASCO|nr:dynamin-related GTPase [Saccharomycopsis crataegensis]